jgi:hypothetical protein
MITELDTQVDALISLMKPALIYEAQLLSLCVSAHQIVKQVV